MINWILHILIDALVLLLAARIMPKVEMRSFGTSLMVAFAVGILSVLIGWLLEFVLNVATLGLFYFTGLGIIIRIFVNAILIEIVDRMSKGFNTVGFLPSLWLAIILAIAGTVADAILFY